MYKVCWVQMFPFIVILARKADVRQIVFNKLSVEYNL